MLNSCVSNVAVVNIDAGFKAGYLASLVARRVGKGEVIMIDVSAGCWRQSASDCDRWCLEPSATSQSSLVTLRLSDAEFMQNRSPVGAGPSGKTWPRWAPHLAHTVSVRAMPWELSTRFSMFSPSSGA